MVEGLVADGLASPSKDEDEKRYAVSRILLVSIRIPVLTTQTTSR
jgi:hypothetical protein